ncbi:hypothetical protein AB9M62_25660 [Bacillales bacterium AN1005]
MTVITAIAARTIEGQKPYVLMGADSLEITLFPDSEPTINANADKIFKINDKLICYSGRVDTVFISEFINHIKVNDCDLKELHQIAYDYLFEYLRDIEQDEEAKCTIFMACCNNSLPELAEIRINKNDLTNGINIYKQLEEREFIVKVAGSIRVPEDDDLFENMKLNFEKKCPSRKISSVRKVAEEYLRSAAARYPATCNQNIKFDRL